MSYLLLIGFLLAGIERLSADIKFESTEKWRESLLERTDGVLKAIRLVDPARNDYALAVDAGSSHSEVILFTWSEKLEGTGFVRQVSNCDVQPGIDKYLELPEERENLLNCIRQMLDLIPDSHPGPFPMLLGATAGMRVVRLFDKEKSKNILTKIWNDLTNFSYKGRQLKTNKPRILTGLEEGQFAWITANYLMKYIPPEGYSKTLDLKTDEDPDEIENIGILDMGGASAQIAFQTETDASEFVSLFGHTYGVKSYSNLCFGSDQARLRYMFLLLLNRESPEVTQVTDPCANDDYAENMKGSVFLKNPCLQTDSEVEINFVSDQVYTFKSAGYSPDKCRAVIAELTDWEDCDNTFKYCFESEEEPLKDHIFYALSSFYWAFKVLPSFSDGKEVITNEHRLLTEIDEWCAKPYDEREKEAGEAHTRALCFKQNFIYYTLKAIYNFDPSIWPQVHFTNDVSGATLGWTLGYMLRKSNLLPDLVRKREEVPDEIIRFYQNIKQLSEDVKNSDSDLLDEEQDLHAICDQLVETLNAELFFTFEKCGLEEPQVECCRSRFPNV